MACHCRVIDQPWGVLRGPDMRGGAHARIVVERRDTQEDVGFGGEFGDHLRTAEGAEPAVLVGRGGVAGELVLAGSPAEVSAFDAGRTVEGGGVRLAAGRAVAVHDRGVELVGFVTDCATEAASVQGHGWISGRV